MSNSIIGYLLPLGGAALLSFGAVAPAMADDGATTYNCRVLGDRSACEQLPAPAGREMVTQVEPGSYARYLINMGRSTEQAIAEARSIGEQPTLRVVVRDSQRHLTSFEAYERLQGRAQF